MNLPSVTLARSYYIQTLSQYYDACDELTDLYEFETPTAEVFLKAYNKFKKVQEKLITCIRVSNYKLELGLPEITYLVLPVGDC